MNRLMLTTLSPQMHSHRRLLSDFFILSNRTTLIYMVEYLVYRLLLPILLTVLDEMGNIHVHDSFVILRLIYYFNFILFQI